MKLDEVRRDAALAGAPRAVREALVASDDPAEWMARLRRVPAEHLALAIAAVRAAATEAPTTLRLKNGVVEAPLFHHGDLVAEGVLQVTAPMWVTGDVTVSGLLRDCGPDSVVAIGGSVRVHSLWTDGEFACGDITADGVVYGYYNDNTLACGRIRARLVVEDDHACLHDGVEAALHLDIDRFARGHGDLGELRALLRAEMFFEEDERMKFDSGALLVALFAGEDVFRG